MENKEMLKKINTGLEAIIQSNLTVKFDGSEDTALAINDVVDYLRRTAFDLQLTSENMDTMTSNFQLNSKHISKAVEQISFAFKDMAKDAENEMKLISNLDSEYSSMQDFLSNLGKNFDFTKGICEEQKKAVVESFAGIKELITRFSGISVDSTEIGERLHVLKLESLKIISFATMVNDIAKQTNMLALNAAIEASRAGEHGKGFAVVAEEIRDLAKKSKEAAKEIKNLMKETQAIIDDIESLTKKTRAEIDEDINKTEEITDALKGIETSFDKVITSMDEGVEIIGSQAKSMKPFMNSLNTLSTLSKQAKDSTESSLYLIEEHAEVIHEINGSTDELGILAKEILNRAQSMASKCDTKSLNTKVSQVETFIKEFQQEVRRSGAIRSKDIATRLEKVCGNISSILILDSSANIIYDSLDMEPVDYGRRDWFRKALKGTRYISQPYISYVGYIPCITIAEPFHDSQGEVAGVISVDIEIEERI